ncbi:MAG: alginate export family protein [Parasphingopyxis sp.]|nr:alginate export family protein [Sphingomonadales bacterium]
MRRNLARIAFASMLLVGAAGAAQAEESAASPGAIEITPLIDARLRYEHVEQPALDADALTLRLRAGVQARAGHFSLLVESEATGAVVDDYNAFPFPLADRQRRSQFSVVADPANIELNRLQMQYASEDTTVTLGRQRINLDDQRWVGSVGWRQNEQTFDALRGEAALGPISLDLTYAIDQRTIFGSDAGPRSSLDGDFVFAGAGASLGPIEGKLFAYLIDYDELLLLANSSQTYGAIVSGSLPLGEHLAVTLRASYARQSDLGRNPFDYAADYWSLEGRSSLAGFSIGAGWEELGSDNGIAVQTPMATLHKFNGWADLFLTTPPAGLQDAWVSVGRSFNGIALLPGLNANIAFHQYDSAAGDIEYGTEWNASLGFRIGPVGLLAKFADYNAVGFGVDTRKFWLQAAWIF